MTASKSNVCSVGDCDRRARRRGMCCTHYERWLDGNPGGPIRRKRRVGIWTRRELFAEGVSKIVRPELGACICWTRGSIVGYGCTVHERKIHLVHRLAWDLVHGPVPDGLCVLHKCDNPPCFNPDHLFLGTHADNIADKVAKGRQARGESAGGSKLTEGCVRSIRKLYAAGGWTYARLGRLFEVHESSVRRILSNKTWRHVE